MHQKIISIKNILIDFLIKNRKSTFTELLDFIIQSRAQNGRLSSAACENKEKKRVFFELSL